MDVHDKETRSRNMKAIKSRDTKPELLVRHMLHHHGFRYRVSPVNLPGKPDIWLAKWNTAIFINGCFWHKHDCGMFHLPSTRREFWLHKLEGNRIRDQVTIQQLISSGKKVLVIWECALRGPLAIPSPMLLTLIRTFLLTGFCLAELTTEGLTIKSANDS